MLVVVCCGCVVVWLCCARVVLFTHFVEQSTQPFDTNYHEEVGI
jgi:hypothetical protein